MLLAYVDESYDKGRYFTTALIIDGDQIASLTADLDRVAEDARRLITCLDRRIELHGYEIFHAEHSWKCSKQMVRARLKVYGDALDAIAATNPAVMHRGVDVRRLDARYTYPMDPHEVALWHLFERIDEHARSTGGDPVLVIADELAIKDQGTHRENLRLWRESGTPGYKSSKLASIVDTIHFAPSKESRCLQAVDLLSFLHFRRQSGVETDPRAIRANEGLWAKIAPSVRIDGCWEP